MAGTEFESVFFQLGSQYQDSPYKWTTLIVRCCYLSLASTSGPGLVVDGRLSTAAFFCGKTHPTFVLQVFVYAV